MAKRQFLFAAKWAATLGPALEERQEVLAALAEVIRLIHWLADARRRS